MSNYLNQIESDLYKLNSITNGSGEVVEMVTEIKEKYEKAKAFDEIMREWEDERMTKSHILETIQKYYDEYESGEYDVKK